jgi:nitrogen regulatory protein PII
VQGHGRQGGRTETFRGAEYTVEFVPKLKLEVLCADDDVDAIVEVIAGAARTGRIGDGKIWAARLDRVQRIRTGEVGDDAV